jgi:hypothetical protein
MRLNKQCRENLKFYWSEPGDLAFDNEDGNIIHVGIIMENNYIITLVVKWELTV